MLIPLLAAEAQLERLQPAGLPDIWRNEAEPRNACTSLAAHWLMSYKTDVEHLLSCQCAKPKAGMHAPSLWGMSDFCLALTCSSDLALLSSP